MTNLRGLQLKKSLGQHFLHDENIARKIVSALQAHPVHRLLEVGPGAGALTRHLLQLPGLDFRAVELDPEKIAFLEKNYPLLGDRLIAADFLKIQPPFQGAFTVVGNFPYNISSQILFKILEWRSQVEAMVGMFQKEMAQRAAAPEGSKTYGVLSVLVQAFYRVEYLFDVQPSSFVPPPKVTSAVIRLVPRTHPLQMRSPEDLTRLVKAAFSQRRKTLRNVLRPYFTPQQLAQTWFNQRAEQVSVEDFGKKTFEMK